MKFRWSLAPSQPSLAGQLAQTLDIPSLLAQCLLNRGLAPVNAEVVGFSGDRAYLMPTDEVQGLSSGATVVPRHLPPLAPQLGQPLHPWRRGEDRAAEYIENLGWQVLARNWRCREGEADIVAYDPSADALVVV